MLDGFLPTAEFWLPVIEAVQPMPIPGDGIWGRLARPFVRPLFDAGKGLAKFGKGLFNLFRGGRRVAQAVCCFVAGTPVLTRDGLVPIEKIELGDEVLSFNEFKGEVEYKPVIQTFERYEKDIIRISVEGETDSLGVTTDHPFYARIHRARNHTSSEDDEGEWIVAGQLQVGDELRLASGTWARITNVKKQEKGAKTYNFEVADNHNYFVGRSSLLVHNNNCVELTRAGTRKIGNLIEHAQTKAKE
ncbi:MAG: polymorphic toxin-type HINT domain-containing protein, partial [Pyrinomonadaceae bacterium]